MAGLVLAYVVRFLAVSLQTVEASLAKVPGSLDDAARALGAGAGETLRRVHLPLLRVGLLTALVLSFVEIMKEMPATLLLRPLGLDTLTVEVWLRTSESMWEEAALPALTHRGGRTLAGRPGHPLDRPGRPPMRHGLRTFGDVPSGCPLPSRENLGVGSRPDLSESAMPGAPASPLRLCPERGEGARMGRVLCSASA